MGRLSCFANGKVLSDQNSTCPPPTKLLGTMSSGISTREVGMEASPCGPLPCGYHHLAGGDQIQTWSVRTLPGNSDLGTRERDGSHSLSMTKLCYLSLGALSPLRNLRVREEILARCKPSFPLMLRAQPHPCPCHYVNDSHHLPFS